MITAERYHDISCGHRVCGHENKCAHLHGHNYRITFVVRAPSGEAAVDSLGRVLDFSVIKSRLCLWLEEAWDHKFLVWHKDPWVKSLREVDPEGIMETPFNPTAENMAAYLLHVIGPRQLEGTGVRLISVRVEETRKCSASSSMETL